MYIEDLRPTQAVVGFREVKRKRNKIEDFKSSHERDQYFKKNSVPVVRGPNGRYYMIDHHHFALAAYEAGYKEVYIHVVEDFSELKEKDFWQEMKIREWVYLKDNGTLINEDDLPKNVKHLKNDPYRALAGVARGQGAFLKTDKPFAEFFWADYYRTRVSRELVENDFEAAVKEAVQVSKSIEAKSLPGYKGKGSCFEAYAPSSF